MRWADICYSQHGEDLIARSVLYRMGIERPSYLDIGCCDPIEMSNTYTFYVLGGHGVLVDGDPNSIEACCKTRPRDTCVNAMIAPTDGKGVFYRGKSCSGSMNRVVLSAQGCADSDVVEVEVETRTLDSVVAEFAGGVYPDLLSIDIEGMDVAVLASANFGPDTPRVIIAEAYCAFVDFHTDLGTVLAKQCFFFYAWAGANMVFVRESCRSVIYG